MVDVSQVRNCIDGFSGATTGRHLLAGMAPPWFS
jgi:hypothetical protein